MKTKRAQTESPIARGNAVFVSVKEIGELDEKGKKVLGLGYSGRSVASPGMPLTLACWFIDELLPFCRYSSPEEAEKDLAYLKKYVNALEANK